MSQTDQLAGPMMRGVAGLHPNETRGSLVKNGSIYPRRRALRRTTAPSACDLKHTLGQIQMVYSA
jgi:hypothetical protein